MEVGKIYRRKSCCTRTGSLKQPIKYTKPNGIDGVDRFIVELARNQTDDASCSQQ